MPQFAFDAVSFRWPGGVGYENLTFSLEPGDFMLLSGPSGQGKSTLLRLMTRLEEPQQGRILYKGTPLAEWQPAKLRRHVTLLQQAPVMGAHTVAEALLLPFTFAANADMPRPPASALEERLAAVRLDNVRLDTPVDGLSLGQRQRVALARVLLLGPDTLLLDEPTSALDPESRAAVEAQVEAANAQGATIVMISHNEYTPSRPVRRMTLRDGILSEDS